MDSLEKFIIESVLRRLESKETKPSPSSPNTKVVLDPTDKKHKELWNPKSAIVSKKGIATDADGKVRSKHTSKYKIVKDPKTGELKKVFSTGKGTADKHVTQFMFKSPYTIINAAIKGQRTRSIRAAFGRYLPSRKGRDSAGKTTLQNTKELDKEMEAVKKKASAEAKKRLKNYNGK